MKVTLSFFPLLSVVVVLLPICASAGVVTDGLVHQWNIERGEGGLPDNQIKDSVGNRDGTFVQSPTWSGDTPGGASSHSLRFDNADGDSVDLGDLRATIDPTKAFTVEVWGKVLNTDYGHVLFSAGNPRARPFAIQFCVDGFVYTGRSGENFVYRLRVGAYAESTSERARPAWNGAESAASPYEMDTWHHVVAVYKGPNLGADPYPIGNPWGETGPNPGERNLPNTAEWTDQAVVAAQANGQAVWMTPQGFGWDEIGERNERGGSRGTRRSPTREEFSNMLYQCLIHGSKGILWWPYVNPRRYAWDHFQKMGRQCRFMEPWLLHGRDVLGMPVGVQIQGEPGKFGGPWKGEPQLSVHWRAWQHDGKALILAANVAKRSVQIDIPLPVGETRARLPFDDVDVETVSDEHLERFAPYIRNRKMRLGFSPYQSVAVVFDLPEM